MSKLHSENAGYVGCSYQETQDPYYSYNKLALPLAGSDKTVVRDEVTFTVTVAGGKFVIDGTSQATLSLKEGVIYKFDQSDTSNSNHPLKFSQTSDGTHSRGTEYYRGVTYAGTPGSSGAYTQLVVPFAGIDLHYYCGNHSGMGSSAATPANAGMFTRALPVLKTTDAFGNTLGSGNNADPYSANLVLAIPMNGTNNGTTFTDVSNVIRGTGSAKAITLYAGSSSGGGVTSTDQSKYYGSSFYAVRGGVNANQSDYITRTGDPDLAFGKGDFTVEFWFYPTSLVSNYVMFDSRHPTTGWPNSSNGFALIGNSSGTIHVYTGGSNFISADYAIQNQANQWHHISVSRQDSFTSLFINGEQKGSIVEDLNDYNEGRFTLGSSSPNGEGTTAYFNDLRIYKGVAKYKPEQSGDTGFQAVRYTGLGSAINRIGANIFSNYSAVSGGTVADADKAFNGSGANWANLTASSTSTAASVDFQFTYPIHGVTKIEAAFDSPSGSGDTRGRYNGANSGATRTGTGSGYSDIYSGAAVTVNSVGIAINQNGSTGTNNDIVSRFRITDSSGTYILVNGQGQNIPFQPDLVWLKNDGSYTGHHVLYDSVRGTTKHIRTSDGTAEYDEDANRSLTKFNVDGFTIDTSGGEHVGPGNINLSGDAYVAYCWKAGGTATSVSTGSLNSSVYDQSQTWSDGMKTSVAATTSYITTGRTTTFDLSFTGQEPFNADLTDFLYGKTGIAGTWIYLEFATALTNVTSIAFSTEYSCPSGIIKLNGADVAVDKADLGGGFVEVNVTGTIPSSLTEIAIQGHGGSARLKYMKINGKYLINAGVSVNNIPSIASSLSASPETGFSIVKWTESSGSGSSTLPHGLLTQPKLIFVKGLTGSVGITAGHDSAGWTKRLKLNDTIAATAGTGHFNDTPPTIKNFTLGSNSVSNDFIAYCFSDVANYQKISSYSGTGSSNNKVTTGFRPQFLLIKADIAGEDWVIMDDARSKIMPAQDAFFANTLGVHTSGVYSVTFEDNGFSVDNNNPRFNTSGQTYYYLAIAGRKPTDPSDSDFRFVETLDADDHSGNSNNVSNAGATFQTSVKKFYDGAAAFTGGTNVNIPSSSELQFGTGDFTIEGWMHPTSYGVTYPTVISKYDNSDTSWILRLHNSGQIVWYNGANGGTNSASSSGLSLLNQWSHVAVVRQAGVAKVYLNGSEILSVADTYNYDDTNTIYFGRQDANNVNGLEGYLQDFRLYKGIAKYTSSFSPPERSVQGTARRYPSGVYVVS